MKENLTTKAINRPLRIFGCEIVLHCTKCFRLKRCRLTNTRHARKKSGTISAFDTGTNCGGSRLGGGGGRGEGQQSERLLWLVGSPLAKAKRRGRKCEDPSPQPPRHAHTRLVNCRVHLTLYALRFYLLFPITSITHHSRGRGPTHGIHGSLRAAASHGV